MKIGIVGSGVAGLAAAWHLAKRGHQAKVFEKSAAVGLGGYFVQPGVPPYGVDVPLRLMNKVQWPCLFSLLQELGVGITEVDSSQSFSRLGERSWLKLDLKKLFKFNPFGAVDRRVGKVVADLSRLRKEAARDFGVSTKADFRVWSLGQYLEHHGYSNEFVNELLYPVLTSTVCTCSNLAIQKYPVGLVVDVLLKLVEGGADRRPSLFRVSDGVRSVAEKLLQRVDQVEVSANVVSVVRKDQAVAVSFQKKNSSVVDVEQFDHVVVATQANQVEKFLKPTDTRIREMLSCFGYEDVSILVHSDESLMPTRRSDWRTFNMVTNPESRLIGSMCSIWLQRYLGSDESSPPLFQTINPVCSPDESKVVFRADLQRPVLTSKSQKGWGLLAEIHNEPERRIWFAGSYASPGIPLQENGVVASRELATFIDSQAVLGV